MVCTIASAARRSAPKTISLGLLAGTLLLALGTVWSAPAAAQDTQSLINRIDRLERDIQTMSRQVYSGGAPKGAAAPPASGGGPVPSGDYAARLEDRISQLESQITQMTGTVETLLHSNSELTAQIQRMSKDNDMRFKELEGGGAAPPPRAATEVPQTASREGNLGTLNPRDLATPPSGSKGAAVPAPAPAPRTSLPAGSPQQQYDYAYGLLTKARTDADNAQAAQAFKDFLDKNSSGPLASAARYWMGRSYVAMKDYDNAARAFLDGYQNDRKGQKAPETLLELGSSLTHMGKTKEACATLDALAREFPAAAKNLSRLPGERKRAGCA